MPEPQPAAQPTNGSGQIRTESAADVQREWQDAMGNGAKDGTFIPPDKWAQLDKATRNRLSNAARTDREVVGLRGEIGQMREQFSSFMADQQRRAAASQNGNGHSNGNGQQTNGQQPLEAQPMEQLLSLRRRARQAERTFRANPEDANAAAIVNHPGFDEYLDNLDLAIQRKTSADAVRPLTEKWESRDKAAGESAGLFARLSQQYGQAVVTNPENDQFKKAADIRATILQQRGVDPTDPANADTVALVTELAWARASAELNRAGSAQGDPSRRRLESPQSQITDSGAPQVDDRMAEISALIAQGERGPAHDLAMKVFNETRLLHPAFNAQARTAR